MDNEIYRAIDKYFCDEKNNVKYVGNTEVAASFFDIFNNGSKVFDDRPDLVVCHKNKCFAVEHFEFDCYERSKKGSKFRKEMARIERVIEVLPPKREVSTIHDVISGRSSYQIYLDNMRKNFIKHYGKIDEYKENIVHKGIFTDASEIEMVFFIEDVSPLGATMYDGEELYHVQLGLSKEFLKLLQDSPKVDYVISCSQVGMPNHIWLISRKTIKLHMQAALDYKRMQFIDMTPNVIGFNAIVEQ